jgi:thiamine biosynthesis lipoprotein ApbE
MRFFQKCNLFHIMDLTLGRPVENMLSVAVLTDTGLDGDALDNVFHYVQGREEQVRLGSIQA